MTIVAGQYFQHTDFLEATTENWVTGTGTPPPGGNSFAILINDPVTDPASLTRAQVIRGLLDRLWAENKSMSHIDPVGAPTVIDFKGVIGAASWDIGLAIGVGAVRRETHFLDASFKILRDAIIEEASP